MLKSSEAYREAVTADVRRMYVKAVVDIEDPDLERGAVTGSEQEPGISRPEQLWDKKFSLDARYPALEPNRLMLDGATGAMAGDTSAQDWEAGLVGALLSGPDGAFAVPQWAQIAFSEVSILQACSVAFSDRPEDGVAVDFTVEVFSDGVAYYTKQVTGNRKALVSLTGWRVNRPDMLRVTVTRWSLPGRRMRIAELVPGVYETWTGDELEEFWVKHQGDPSCLTLPYGTGFLKMDNESRRFDPRSKDGVFQSIEDRQGVEFYMGPGLPDGTVDYKPLGVFYQSGDGWKTGDNSLTMAWSLVDIVGLLASRRFKPPAVLPTTLKGWLEALAGQLGKNFARRVRVDPGLADEPVSYQAAAGADPREALANMSCGDILRLVCMAAGAWPRADASTGYLAAEPLWNEGNKLTLDDLNRYPTMSANKDAASVTVNGYETQGNAPACGNTVEVDDPFIGGESRSVQTARALLAFYGGNKLELTGRGDPSSEIGDVDAIWLAEGNVVTARRIRQELRFSNGVLKDCTSTLIRGDGLFSFQSRVQLLEGGTWTVPPGVWRIFAVLVGRGQDGRRGGDGAWNNSVNMFMGSYIYPQAPNGGSGADGADGAGGMVWAGAIDVNPGQVLSAQLGEQTVLWHYSSADGKRYPNGYTDVATGQVYGRSGVANARPGSGDGGVGGKGGQAGSWYEQSRWYYDDGHVPAPGMGSIVIPGVDPSYRGPGHYETETVVERAPTSGTPGTPGASGCIIIYYDKPEAIEE